jgi:hypothetical protein
MSNIIKIKNKFILSNNLKKTKHLTKRSSQRGLTDNDIENIFNHADHETYLGDGRISYSISKKAIKSKKLRNIIPIKELERIKSCSLVVADGHGVTVIKGTSNNSRHYFKQTKRRYYGKR